VAAGLAATMVLAGCSTHPTSAAERQAESGGQGHVEPGGSADGGADRRPPHPMRFRPLAADRFRTTDGEVYVGNLEALVATLETRLVERPSDSLRRLLAEQLLHRYQIRSLPDDLDAAERLTRAIIRHHDDPGAALLMARIEAARHHFDAALARLDRLEPVPDALAPAVRDLRLDIELALGGVPAPATPPTLASLAREASVALDRGRLDQAMGRYHLALASLNTTNPYRVAWLETRIGIAYLRFGHLAGARQFLEAALQRLPAYVVARDHLAETLVEAGETAAAVPIYQALVEDTGDPEFCGVLAELHPQADQRRRYEDCARDGFADRIARHPEAYWHHAAEWAMDQGNRGVALAWARANARLRPDASARALLVRMLMLAGETDAACAALDRLIGDGWNPPEITPAMRSPCS